MLEEEDKKTVNEKGLKLAEKNKIKSHHDG